MRHGLLAAVVASGCFYVTEAERAARWDLDGDGVERPADCDDADAEVSELSLFHADADDDGFGDPDVVARECRAPPGFVLDGGDCDDTLDSAYPGAPEICDHADNDCDRQIDEGLSDFDWWIDADGDDHGDEAAEPVRDCSRPPDHAPTGDDCDDGNPNVHPDVDEICGNGVDDDCVAGDAEC